MRDLRLKIAGCAAAADDARRMGAAARGCSRAADAPRLPTRCRPHGGPPATPIAEYVRPMYPAFARAAASNGARGRREDTIFQGTVTNFGHFNKDGRSSRHCYGFIKIDHSGNEVFVSEEDAPDGSRATAASLELSTRVNNRRTGAKQWKATDVVCIQRVTPVPERRAAELERKIQIKAVERSSWSLSKRTAARCASSSATAKYEHLPRQAPRRQGPGLPVFSGSLLRTRIFDARGLRPPVYVPTGGPRAKDAFRSRPAGRHASRRRESVRREATCTRLFDRPAVEADVRALSVHREARVSQLAEEEAAACSTTSA